MITLASFVPHPPLLIPEIGQDNLGKLAATVQAYQYLEHELYAAQVDTVLVISPHSEIREKAFTINQSPKLRTNFKDFGDLITNFVFDTDLSWGYQIKESCETTLPIILSAVEVIDYGTAVPLYYLAKNRPGLKVVALNPSQLSRAEHVRFGQIIREAAAVSPKRIALIASGDLSHRLHKDSPAGYSARAHEFDQQIRKLLKEKKIKEIIDLPEDMVREAGECGYRSLLILLGAIGDMNFATQELAYEAPFGIGYLTVNFKILR